MKKMFIFLTATALIFSLSQCSKTGPEGPQGDQGATGAKGDKGATGTTGAKGDKGDPGNANVLYTAWTKRSSWVPQAASTAENTQGSVYSNIIVANDWSISGLTAESAVMVYVRSSSASAAHIIPDKFYAYGGGKSGTVLFRYHYAQTWLMIYAVLVEGTWDYTGYMKNTYMPAREWRVVIIKGSTKVARSSAPLPDPNDYKAVCAYYGIPE